MGQSSLLESLSSYRRFSQAQLGLKHRFGGELTVNWQFGRRIWQTGLASSRAHPSEIIQKIPLPEAGGPKEVLEQSGIHATQGRSLGSRVGSLLSVPHGPEQESIVVGASVVVVLCRMAATVEQREASGRLR